MRNITTFQQANQALDRFISTPSGPRRYSLDRMRQLMNSLGNPQNKLKVIHVAGTSGKTSTAYFVASLLQNAGFSTGLTVSPHVDEVNERTQVDMKSLPEQEFCYELGQFLKLVDASNLQPTYFEVLVAFSFWLFERRKVDYAVVEVGIGGLLDCTNVINRDDKVCVITDIGMDHTEILGDTIEEIAAQKAGIIQSENAAFISRQSDAVMTSITRQCQNAGVELHVNSGLNKKSDLSIFQRRNFGLALDAVSYVLMRDANKKLDDAIVKEAASVYIPGRMEIVNYKHKTLILDGSHNEQKISALVEGVAEKFPEAQVTLLVCFGRNKQSSLAKSMKKLSQLSTKIILTSFGDGQIGIWPSMDPLVMAAQAKKAGFKTIIVEPRPEAAFEMLMKDDSPIGLVTGSFYLLNAIRPVVFGGKS